MTKDDELGFIPGSGFRSSSSSSSSSSASFSFDSVCAYACCAAAVVAVAVSWTVGVDEGRVAAATAVDVVVARVAVSVVPGRAMCLLRIPGDVVRTFADVCYMNV